MYYSKKPRKIGRWADHLLSLSAALARLAPGVDLSTFRMPGLHTINHFISLYFERFDQQMPIIHLPTFKVTEAPPLLLAGMIGLGATFSRLPGAKTLSTEISDVIRTTLNVLFDYDSSNVSSRLGGWI